MGLCSKCDCWIEKIYFVQYAKRKVLYRLLIGNMAYPKVLQGFERIPYQID